ncbi:ThiF family adenylyltransferase [Acinetobacter sp. ANC 4177]|uniref:ThiF family adenylyltransferase n=1 Tax=Acinetobacter sp. ANC 4177 TaxID=2529838 RepID=UPI00103942E0|nr:ThiF family adenylyltransferase [Acinetobacter sp. ANC 4177]TCB75664.1 hypothetical protein E0H91_04515 [Acinetobacter sp. ANC 4177]
MLDAFRRQQLIEELHKNGFRRLSIDSLIYKNEIYSMTPQYNGDEIFYVGKIELSVLDNLYYFDILIRIYDQTLISLPTVYLISPIDSILKLPVPHITPKVDLRLREKDLHTICYAFADDITIPRYNPKELVKFIISQTKQTLVDVIVPTALNRNLNNEIEPMWVCLSNRQKSICSAKKFGLFPSENKKIIDFKFIGEDSNIRLNGKLVYVSSKCQVPEFSIFLKPDFKVISLNHFFLWIKLWDISAYVVLLNSLKYFREFEKHFFFGFFYNGAILYFSIKLDSSTINRMMSLKNLNKFKFNGNQNLGFSVGTQIDLNNMVNRNLQDLTYKKSLKELRILQVGCGSIGGYLVDALFKVGATNGERSQLTLVDSDYLKTDNLGRHFLGSSYLGLNKAEALKTHFEINYKKYLINGKLNINFEKFDIEIIDKSFFDDFDLIIDATGKFEVAQYLNEVVNEKSKEKQIPILHLWIFANGECVQALWNDSKILSNNGGCHHCLTTLWDTDSKSYYPLKDTNRETTIRVSRPCSNYTPYSVSSSLNVVGLAIEILLAWKAENLNNNYFTNYAPTSLTSRNDELQKEVYKQAHCLICK